MGREQVATGSHGLIIIVMSLSSAAVWAIPTYSIYPCPASGVGSIEAPSEPGLVARIKPSLGIMLSQADRLSRGALHALVTKRKQMQSLCLQTCRVGSLRESGNGRCGA